MLYEGLIVPLHCIIDHLASRTPTTDFLKTLNNCTAFHVCLISNWCRSSLPLGLWVPLSLSLSSSCSGSLYSLMYDSANIPPWRAISCGLKAADRCSRPFRPQWSTYTPAISSHHMPRTLTAEKEEKNVEHLKISQKGRHHGNSFSRECRKTGSCGRALTNTDMYDISAAASRADLRGRRPWVYTGLCSLAWLVDNVTDVCFFV